MEYTHCGKPMEVLTMPNKSPIAPGASVGLRCTVCFEVIPNALLSVLEAEESIIAKRKRPH